MAWILTMKSDVVFVHSEATNSSTTTIHSTSNHYHCLKSTRKSFLDLRRNEFRRVALTLKTKGGLELLSFDDLYYKLKTLEVDIKGYSTFSSSQSACPSHSAFVSNTSASKKMSYADSPSYTSSTYTVPSNSKTGSHRSSNVIEDLLQSFVADTEPEQQLAYEDFDQIEKLYLEEMDLKWQIDMLYVRVHKFEQKAGRKIDFDKKESARANGGNDKQRYSSFKIQEIGKKEEDSKALITVDTLVDWTEHDGQSDGVIAPKEFGMIAGCDTEDAIEEGDASEFALMGVTSEVQAYKNSLKTLEKQKRVLQKNQLTLEDKIRVLSIELENTTNLLKHSERINAIAETAKEELQTKLDNHLVQIEKGRTSSKNLFRLIDSSIDKSSEVNTNDFASSDSSVKSSEPKSNDSTSCASTSSVSTSESEAEIESNVGTPIQEPIIVQELPSFSCTDKDVKTSRTPCNKNGYFNNKKASHFRKNNSSASKSCFVCGSYLHLIKDCNYYETQYPNDFDGVGYPQREPIWDNATRVTQSNQFVPQAVLLRSGKVSIPAARPNQVPAGRPKPVSTGRPKPVSTGKQNRPPPVHAGRRNSSSVTSGWWQSTARPMTHFAFTYKFLFSDLYIICTSNEKYYIDAEDEGVFDSGCSRSNDEYMERWMLSRFPIRKVTFEWNCSNSTCSPSLRFVTSKNRVLFKTSDCLCYPMDFMLPDEILKGEIWLVWGKASSLYDLCKDRRMGHCLTIKNHSTGKQLMPLIRALKMSIIELCGSKGIKRDYSNARTPQQNRVAERKNRTLIEAARTMLADSKLPTMFWTEAFDGKADEGYIVGYSASNKAYRVYNVPTKRVEETMNLRYLEEKPNVQGLGHEWYFDLDYLTDSLGYKRDKANQSTGTQETSTNPEGTQDADSDSEYDEQVIIVPSYPSHSIQEAEPKDTFGYFRRRAVTKSIPTSSILVPFGDTTISPGVVPVPTGSLTDSFFDDKPTTRFPSPSDLGNNEPSPGIFSSSSYDDEFGADLNNLALTVEVSPMATKRINTIHPQSLIIKGSIIQCANKKQDVVAQALEDPSWVDAMQEEMQQFKFQNVWVLVDLPEDKYAIGTKWILKNKRDARGIVVRNKARLVLAPEDIDRRRGIVMMKVLLQTATTPYEAPKPKSKNEPDSPVNVHLYRSMIGSLMYLTASRPDIMFAVSALLRLHGTLETSPFVAEALLSDSDYARANRIGNPQHQSGDVSFWVGVDLMQCKSNTFLATSSTEAVYVVRCFVVVITNGYKRVITYCSSVLTWTTVVGFICPKVFHSGSSMCSLYGWNQVSLQVVFIFPTGRPLPTVSTHNCDQHPAQNLNLISTASMAALRYRDEHNKVGYLQKPKGSDDYHQILDFLGASHIRSPELGPPAILATIDATPYTITEDSVRGQLQLADDGGIDDLPIADIYFGMDNLGYITKYGSWDQLVAPIVVALICLLIRRKYLTETSNTTPYKVFKLSSKLFANIKLNFEGQPMPLLAAMLSQAGEGAGEVLSMRSPRSTQSFPMPVTLPGGVEDPYYSKLLLSLCFLSLSAENLDALHALANAVVTIDSTKSLGGASSNPAACSYDPTSDIPTTDIPTDVPSGFAPTWYYNATPSSPSQRCQKEKVLILRFRKKDKELISTKDANLARQMSQDFEMTKDQRKRQQDGSCISLQTNQMCLGLILVVFMQIQNYLTTIFGVDFSDDDFVAKMVAFGQFFRRKELAVAYGLKNGGRGL
ncbi:ribonuclease H-like domain-containing protein [Tanacetum coccineum]